jgi:hypothetical protein
MDWVNKLKNAFKFCAFLQEMEQIKSNVNGL